MQEGCVSAVCLYLFAYAVELGIVICGDCRYCIYVYAIYLCSLHLCGKNSQHGCTAAHVKHDLVPYCIFVLKKRAAHHVGCLMMTRSESHLRVYRDVVSCSFESFVERCLDRTLAVHHDRCELAFPNCVPVDCRHQVCAEFCFESKSFKSSENDLESLCVIKLLLDVAFEDRILNGEGFEWEFADLGSYNFCILFAERCYPDRNFNVFLAVHILMCLFEFPVLLLRPASGALPPKVLPDAGLLRLRILFLSCGRL